MYLFVVYDITAFYKFWEVKKLQAKLGTANCKPLYSEQNM